ncbi:hypothetical protein KUCAC02_017349, partial [Chaenocephalus aceratus]
VKTPRDLHVCPRLWLPRCISSVQTKCVSSISEQTSPVSTFCFCCYRSSASEPCRPLMASFTVGGVTGAGSVPPPRWTT